MYEFDVHDEMAANGSMHFRVLRTLLTSHLPRMLPELQNMMKRGFANEVLQGYTKTDGILLSFCVYRNLRLIN